MTFWSLKSEVILRWILSALNSEIISSSAAGNMCSIQQICCMIHSSAQRSYSPTYEYYLLSKLYISYSGKNSIGLSVNLSEYKGLGSPGRVMKKKTYYIKFH